MVSPHTKKKNIIFIIVDVIMMLLLFMNMTLIIFDWLFNVVFINQRLQELLPAFYHWYYLHIHLNFFQIDLVFVLVFLTEFMISWSVNIYHKTYYRWFFYPFIHWYDLLGCIPVDTFRFVRLFRVFSILYRLHNLEVIDLSKTYVYQKIRKYYDILVEEVSDRVVVQIIDGIQTEVSHGGPMVRKIVHEVLRPQQDLISEWVSHRLRYVAQYNYDKQKENIREYVENIISVAINKNSEANAIKQIPWMGKVITDTIKHAVSDMLINVIDQSMQDLASDKNKSLVNEITNITFDSIEVSEENQQLQDMVIDTTLRVLEIIKDQVKVQQWKLQDHPESSNPDLAVAGNA